jgi:predicted flap endonuclease-1-like 5' DNA nuclease
MTEHIFEIVIMLLGTAILGFLIAWFWRNNKIEELEQYIRAIEDKNNRLQAEYNKIEQKLIDCQTEKKKKEAVIGEFEKRLAECQANLIVSDLNLIKTESEIKKIVKPKKQSKAIKSVKTDKISDNLTKIEGIGPKISSILKSAGIDTYKKLSLTKPTKISELLIQAGGNSYNRFDPATWPNQAKLADQAKWDELKKWQDELKGGKKE